MNVVLAPRWASCSLQLATSAYVDCGTPAILSNLTSFTLEAWINPDSVTGFQIIAGNTDNATGGQYQLLLSDGNVCAYVGIAPYVIISPGKISVGNWYHIASTFDSTSNILTLYIDGVQVATANFPGSLPTQGTNMLIGAGLQQGSPTSYYTGLIGRVMIWNTTRTTEEILKDSVQLDLYSGTRNVNLIFYVDFSVMPTVDSSGNSTALTYKNGAQYNLSVPSVVLGPTGYVDCGSFADYSIPGNAPYTIEGWMFPYEESSGTIISYGKNSAWEYRVSYQGNKLIGQRNSDTLQISSNTAIIANSYYHFALTYDSTTKALSLYVNGNLQAVDYFESPVTAVPNGNVLVGAQYDASGTPTNFFNGAVQNLRIWNVCLEQPNIYQWMFNDVVNDNQLISNYDFTVSPPINTTDRATLLLQGGAIQRLQNLPILPTDPIAQLGIPQSINAVYLNQNKETPLTPPTDILFGPQAELFSEDHKEQSWSDFITMFGLADKAEQQGSYREQFETGYAKAKELFSANPKLAKVITRTDENGMTRVVYHGIKGDMLVYEGAIGAESDCTIWWISFIFSITVGFFQAIGLLPSTGDIATRIYNLVRANQTVMNALTSMMGKTITAASAIGIMGVIYQQGLIWTIIKFVLTSAGWYALFWILRKVIAIVTGLEAAAILAGFIVWASRLTKMSFEYNSQCGQALLTAPPAA